MSKPDLLLADALAKLSQDRDAIPWEERRSVVRRATGFLQSGRQAKAAMRVADLLVDDRAWEVRQAVAEMLVYFPDGDKFNGLAGKLTQDCNGFVLQAVDRAIDQRRRCARESARQRDTFEHITRDLQSFERVHGPLAAAKARSIAERMYEFLVATAVHELRRVMTPMRETIGSLASRSSNKKSPPTECQAELGQLSDRFEFLLRIVSDMGAMSQALSRERQKHQLADVVAQAHAMVVDDLGSVGCEPGKVHAHIDVPQDLRVAMARHEIVVAIANLLQNAYEVFLDEDGRLVDGKIEVRVSRLDDENIELRICDNGRGLTPTEIEEAFVPGKTMKINRGTGYGLPIARQRIAAHGGTITMESQVGHGTTVKVVLPVNDAEENDK
jgi:signal transduction histidine kinase